jgi:hypothetical protein
VNKPKVGLSLRVNLIITVLPIRSCDVIFIGVKTLSLLRNRHKNPPIHTPCDLHRFGS